MTKPQYPGPSEALKVFAMSNLLAESDLDAVERRYTFDLGRGHQDTEDRDDTYYPQFEEAVRREAAEMSAHYELFYCLEKSIRQLITETLEAEDGAGWWTGQRVPQNIQQNAADRIQKERDSGVTARSTEPLDYTTFGELGEIIKTSWELFGSIFNSKKAVEKVMASLNTLRGPIAHCSPLAEDEVLRLQLTLRDWFRLME